MLNPLLNPASSLGGPKSRLALSSVHEGRGADIPRLSLYDQPPPDELSLEEFEQFALDRLQVLRELESASLRNMSEEQLRQVLKEAQKKYLPWQPPNAARNGADLEPERRKDFVSHYILRLAYCRSEDLRSWFVRQETLLFRLRWEMLQPEERIQFLSLARLNISPIPTREKDALLPLLLASSSNTTASDQFYRVPFERVPDLVSRREVYLRAGDAYVPHTHLISIILGDFKRNLMGYLEILAKMVPRMDEDDRLKPVLVNMSKVYGGKRFGEKGEGVTGKVSADDVDELVEHFPPCMAHLQYQLNKDHHLKHFGRQQFGLFLKGIGLSLEDALLYWRRAFSKLSDDQFNKSYAYNIRHNYGQEGKRADYTPYSCMKIITSNQPSAGDQHGCPFKHFSKGNLVQMLQRNGIGEERVARDVADLAKQGHFQVACTRFFEVTRGKVNPHTMSDDGAAKPEGAQHNVMDTIAHPNQFFELSLKMANITLDKDDEKDTAKEDSAKMEVDR